MTITRASNTIDFKKIEALAFEIIPEFYADTIPYEHNIFFVETFQTVDALKDQLKKGYEYYLLIDADITLGYFGLQIDKELSLMNLSKLYLLKQYRGKGHGTKSMDFIIARANELALGKITLTVNRENDRTIRLYEKYGFSITKHLVNQFDNGHTILDYEMTRIND